MGFMVAELQPVGVGPAGNGSVAMPADGAEVQGLSSKEAAGGEQNTPILREGSQNNNNRREGVKSSWGTSGGPVECSTAQMARNVGSIQPSTSSCESNCNFTPAIVGRGRFRDAPICGNIYRCDGDIGHQRERSFPLSSLMLHLAANYICNS